jgi:hypothetical protein
MPHAKTNKRSRAANKSVRNRRLKLALQKISSGDAGGEETQRRRKVVEKPVEKRVASAPSWGPSDETLA